MAQPPPPLPAFPIVATKGHCRAARSGGPEFHRRPGSSDPAGLASSLLCCYAQERPIHRRRPQERPRRW
ncbi:hypothetical protein E2562_005461 [Oryza meyeriana var. granulata]|uniref:Uncharacterized protein n=1 Tax=Oryza meyeriana var. granulata TaxID=110450 RepID=A0A6G1DEN1_9ORYZ|nr:hypothetical protein E2562_005461 [Oryza meyeriana var. granulata]